MRGHRLEDFAHCAAMWADPVVTRFIGGRPFSEEESWAKLLRYVGHWSLLGFGYWAIEEKATGSFVGESGFAEFKRDIEPSIKGVPELGWALVSRFHGRGYATECVRAAVDWGEAHLPSQRMVCLIDPENVASIHVANKCGFRKCRQTTYRSQPTTIFARDGCRPLGDARGVEHR